MPSGPLLGSDWSSGVPAVGVGAHADEPREYRQGWEDEVLDPDRRRGCPAFVAEVPDGGAELQRVLRRASGSGFAFGREAGEGLEHLLGLERGTELDHADDVARS